MEKCAHQTDQHYFHICSQITKHLLVAETRHSRTTQGFFNHHHPCPVSLHMTFGARTGE